jgi:hypothetical protein
MTATLSRARVAAPPPRTAARPATPHDATLYLARQTDDHPHRHLSAVPLLPGLEAMCGQPLTATSRPLTWSQAISLATCPGCREHASKLLTNAIH